MTPRERLIAPLERRPLNGRAPHFEQDCLIAIHGDATCALPSGDNTLDSARRTADQPQEISNLMLDIWKKEGNYL